MYKWLPLLLIIVLVGCSQQTTTQPTNSSSVIPEVTEPEMDEQDEETALYNGYTPKTDEAKKYFEIISNYQQWSSAQYDFDYTEVRADEDAMLMEYHVSNQIIYKPYQLYESTHSIFFNNDMYEVYANENEAYQNHNVDGWEKVDDPKNYVRNPAKSRAELYYALIDQSTDAVDDGTMLAFMVSQNSQEKLYEQIWLSYFYNETFAQSEKTNTLDLFEPLNELENIYVEVVTDGKQLIGMNLIIYFNRTDAETVDRNYFEERFSYINELTSIDIPEEAKQSSN